MSQEDPPVFLLEERPGGPASDTGLFSGVFPAIVALARSGITIAIVHSHAHLAFYRSAASSLLTGNTKALVLTQLEDEGIIWPRGTTTIYRPAHAGDLTRFSSILFVEAGETAAR